VQQIIRADPFSGHVFLFRGKRGHYLKGLYWDGSGMCLFAKRLERGKFVWPPLVDDTMMLTPAQLALRRDRPRLPGYARAMRHRRSRLAASCRHREKRCRRDPGLEPLGRYSPLEEDASASQSRFARNCARISSNHDCPSSRAATVASTPVTPGEPSNRVFQSNV